MPARILVTADTHIPDFARELPRALLRAAARSDLVLHAGDVTTADVLDALSACAPVHVALGNNDREDVAAFGASPEISLAIEDVVVAMVHDAGPRAGREGRLARRFPNADLVVFGHSHIPMITELDGRRLLNPGSPTWKRREPRPTYATVTVDGRRTRIRIVQL
jgi:putative phosphoesterase